MEYLSNFWEFSLHSFDWWIAHYWLVFWISIPFSAFFISESCPEDPFRDKVIAVLVLALFIPMLIGLANLLSIVVLPILVAMGFVALFDSAI